MVSDVSPEDGLWDPQKERSAKLIDVPLLPRTLLDASQSMLLPGITPRQPQSVDALLLFPTFGATVPLRYTPKVFGVWKYERMKSLGDQKPKELSPYHPVSSFNFYALEQAVLHVLAPPGATVTIALNVGGTHDVELWRGKTDSGGQLVVEDLRFLSNSCDAEYTPFLVWCGAKTLTVGVRWTPEIDNFWQEGEQVLLHGSGPPESELKILWRGAQGDILERHRGTCRGEGFTIRCSPTLEDTPRRCREVHVQTVRDDGTIITAARKLRYEPSLPTSLIPVSWLEAGFGVSEASLLTQLTQGFSTR